MSIKVERKGDKLKVETDYPGSEVSHAVVHENPTIRAAMTVCGIDKIETQKNELGATSSVQEGFNREYKKKYGKDNDYFNF